jgi:hypothetical protein
MLIDEALLGNAAFSSGRWACMTESKCLGPQTTSPSG